MRIFVSLLMAAFVLQSCNRSSDRSSEFCSDESLSSGLSDLYAEYFYYVDWSDLLGTIGRPEPAGTRYVTLREYNKSDHYTAAFLSLDYVHSGNIKADEQEKVFNESGACGLLKYNLNLTKNLIAARERRMADKDYDVISELNAHWQLSYDVELTEEMLWVVESKIQKSDCPQVLSTRDVNIYGGQVLEKTGSEWSVIHYISIAGERHDIEMALGTTFLGRERELCCATTSNDDGICTGFPLTAPQFYLYEKLKGGWRGE